MEGTTNETCLDTVLDLLYQQKYSLLYKHLERPIEMLRQEIRFLKMFLWGLGYWEDLKYDWHLCLAAENMITKLNQIAEEFVADCLSDDYSEQCQDLELRMYDFEKTIDEQLRPLAKDVCILLLGSADYKCTPCPPNQKAFLEYGRDTASFIELILRNLKALLNSNLVASVVEQQMALIQCKLEEYAVPLVSVKKYELSRARTWFTRISCLTYLYWSDAKDEYLASAMETVLFGLLHITMPFGISGVISSHLKATNIPQLLSSHLDLLENYAVHMKGATGILHEGLLFLLSFILYPPDDGSEDIGMIWSHVCAAINKFRPLFYSICSN